MKIINKKITTTLTQDISVYMSLNNFDNKYYKFEIIKNYYKKKIHQNIKMYLNYIYNKIHIIYTFSHILEPLFQENEIYSNDNFENSQNYLQKELLLVIIILKEELKKQLYRIFF